VDVQVRGPDGQPRRERCVIAASGRRAALAFEAKMRAAMLDGTYGKEVAAPAPTLAAFATDYMGSQLASRVKPSTRAAKEGIIRNHLIPRLGRIKVDAMGPRDVDRFCCAQEKAGCSPKTINNQLAVLSSMLNTAAEWRLVEQPCKIRFLRVLPPEFDFLDFADAKRLVEAAEPGLWRTAVVTVLHTGLRLGEMMALRWQDVDLRKGLLLVRQSRWKNQFVTPKSRTSMRDIPLNRIAVSALTAHRHLRGTLVFCGDDGSPLSAQICRGALMRACKKAGLRHIGWHVLRHSFASHMVMRGKSLKAVQELLGHASMQMTLRYAHLTPEVRRDAVDALAEPAPTHSAERRESGAVAAT
jgi:integrase